MLLRGRAMYRLVRVGLLPAGGGFGSLVDHAIKMGARRRALDDDMAEFRAIGDRKIALAHKLDDLATRRAPLELEREAADEGARSARRGGGSPARFRQGVRNVDRRRRLRRHLRRRARRPVRSGRSRAAGGDGFRA